MLRVTEYYAKSIKITQGHSKLHSLEYGLCMSLLVLRNVIVTMYVVPFLRYSASNNGVTLKFALKVVQGH